MIPKIAWMHWTGPPMSWLRAASVESFKRHHPDWDIRVIDTPPDIQKYDLSYAHQGDWTRWRMLAKHGGFAVGADNIFVKPIPDEWLDADLCAQERGGNIYQMAAVGCAPGHSLACDANNICEAEAPNGFTDYQSLGVALLKRITQNRLPRMFGRFYKMPDSALCFYHFENDMNYLWSADGPPVPLPDEAIGVQWFGAHSMSKKMEPRATGSGEFWIERLAMGEA